MPTRKIDWVDAVSESLQECVRCGAPDGEYVMRPKVGDKLWWRMAEPNEEHPDLSRERVYLQLGLCRHCAKRDDAFSGVSGAFGIQAIRNPNGEITGYRKANHSHKWIPTNPKDPA